MSQKPLKLHWSSSKPNFGDCLSPQICTLLSGREVIYHPPRNCDFVALGSLLHRFKHKPWTKKVNVWGTGFIRAGDPVPLRHHYHAIRGKLSQSRILGLEECVLGDPGLLSFMLLEKRPDKHWKLGIVQHFEDANNPVVSALLEKHPDIKLIDIMSPVDTVLSEIVACEVILSSAMHGLIAADSLGVPNAWIELSDQVRGEGYKFADYYSAFDLYDIKPLKLTEQLVTAGLAEVVDNYQRPNIDSVKKNIYEAFPYLKREI